MPQKPLRPVHDVLLGRINRIDYSGPESVEDAKFVKTIISEMIIGPEHLVEIENALSYKFGHTGFGGNPTYVEPTHRHLREACAGLKDQYTTYVHMLGMSSDGKSGNNVVQIPQRITNIERQVG